MHDHDSENGEAHGAGMAARGSSRPMQHGGGDHGEPYSSARWQLLQQHHRQTLWVPWLLILLGVWTALAPWNFGYLNAAQWVDPSGGRGAWWSASTHTALRASLTTWSDVLSGVLLVLFGWRALQPGRPVSRWILCGVGCWLSAAPILFWAPTAAAYANDTLVGMLVIALTILIPGMPNMILYMRMGEPVPPGWSYNPSSWAQRWIMIATGFLGLLASRYLAMFQLGYVDDVWDPLFGDGSRRVLNSAMSHSLPISDAGLGALAYTFEFLMGFMGSPTRWRTMPWMVTLFGILVIPLGLVHIALVISQPVVVGAWCTFCLLAAAIMLPMIPLEVDEVVAMGQHLRRARRRGHSLWQAFWKGGPVEDDATADQAPGVHELPRRPGAVLAASVRGMTAPWTLTVSAALGIAAMALPGGLGLAQPASAVFHLGGALVVVAAVVGMGEPVRALRLLNVPLGLGLAALPWFLDGAGPLARGLGALLGAAIAGLALPRGVVRERFGSWDRLVV